MGLVEDSIEGKKIIKENSIFWSRDWMKRDTKEMSTSSQTVMNLTDRILQITYFKDKVEEFKGINKKLPEGYQPKITIEVISI